MGETAQIIVAIAAMLSAFASAAAVAASVHNSKKITEIHLLINSRLSELLDATKAAAVGEGIEQERQRKDATGKPSK